MSPLSQPWAKFLVWCEPQPPTMSFSTSTCRALVRPQGLGHGVIVTATLT